MSYTESRDCDLVGTIRARQSGQSSVGMFRGC